MILLIRITITTTKAIVTIIGASVLHPQTPPLILQWRRNLKLKLGQVKSITSYLLGSINNQYTNT